MSASTSDRFGRWNFLLSPQGMAFGALGTMSCKEDAGDFDFDVDAV